MYASLWKLGLEATLLAIQAQQNIAQGLAKAMFGSVWVDGKATHTALEKKSVVDEATMTAAPGRPPYDIVRGYRRKARASKQRLSMH